MPVSVPNDFQNNTTADAEGVDANFNAITEFINDDVMLLDGTNQMAAELPLVDGGNAASQTYVDARIPAVTLVGTELVSGEHTFNYSGFASTATSTRTFGTTFVSAPAVFLSVRAVNAATNFKTFAFTTDITTTQFVLNINMDANFSDSTQQFVVSWIAIGQVA